MTLSEVLSRFPGAKKDKPDHWMAPCPVHEADGQHNPSLSITVAQDKILLHCFGECRTPDIVAAVGMKESDLFFEEKRQPRTFVKAYDYVDPAGTLLFQAVRWEPKTFTQRRPDGNGGWINNLEGVTPCLYRLPEVLAAVTRGSWVWIVEGEKDADTLAAAGLTATTNPMGALKWREEYSAALRGAHVVIIPDADGDKGPKHAAQVYASIRPHAQSVRYLIPPGGCKDVTDYSDKVQASPDRLRFVLEKLAEVAPDRPPEAMKAVIEEVDRSFHVEVISDTALRQMTFIPPRQVIPGLIHSGVTILAAGPKVGKSFFCLQGAQAVAHGGYAFGSVKCEQADALCFFMEDGGGRIQGRLRRLDASSPHGDLSTDHLSYVFDLPPAVKKDRRLFTDKVLKPLTDRMENLGLIVVDTLTKIRPRSAGKNQNLYEVDYDAIEPFQELAKSRQVAVVFVHHVRKALSEDPLEEVSGTLGLTGSADSILVIKRKRFERRGVLSIISRDIGETALSVEYDEETNIWSIMGPADKLAVEQEHQEILEILSEKPNGMEPHMIGREIGKTASGARKVLKRMLDLGMVSQDGGRFRALLGSGKKTSQERLHDHVKECSGSADGKPCPVCEQLYNQVMAESRDGRLAAAGGQ